MHSSFFSELKRRNVLRVATAYAAIAWLLIQVAETVMPLYGFDDAAARTVVTILAIGFVPVVVLAWAFEWTPEGIRKDSHTAPRAPGAGKWLDRVIVVTLVMAVSYFAIDKFLLDPARDAAKIEEAKQQGRKEGLLGTYGEQSIAVLPFDNLSDDPSQDSLALGIAEELLNLLSRVDGLRVISRRSAFSFRSGENTTVEIAAKLDVAYVLEGSVRKSGDALRITAQLIDARADAHVWSDTYDRQVEDIFVIQDEVAAAVVGNLQIELNVAPPTAKTHNPVAYALLLQARLKLVSAELELDRAEELLDQALSIDPEYSDAKVWLSWVYELRAREAEHAGDETLAARHYERKLEIMNEVAARHPDNVQLNVALGWEYMRNIELASTYFMRALAGEPTNTEALNGAAVLLMRLWREEEAVEILRYLSERDPLNIHVAWNLSRAYLNTGQFDRMRQVMHKYQALNPDAVYAPWLIGLSYVFQSKPEVALQLFVNSVSDDILKLHGMTLALHELGRNNEAGAALAELAELYDADDQFGNLSFLIATAYAWTGDIDRAFFYLEKQRDIDSGVFRVAANNPLYENLRDDPRWRPFLASVELAPDRLDAIEFDPRLPPAIRN